MKFLSKFIFLFFFFSVVTFHSCEKIKEVIPYVYVNFYVDLTDPQFIDLTVPGNSVKVTGGVKGLLIYRKTVGETDDFAVFDRMCTYELDTDCRIDVENTSSLYAKCECCESEFNLFGAYFESGVAKIPLKLYNSDYNVNTKILHIYN